MQAPRAPAEIFRFGIFHLDLKAGELRKAGVKVKLQDQPFRVLATLVDRAGQVVTREELRQNVWPTDVYVIAFLRRLVLCKPLLPRCRRGLLFPRFAVLR